MRNAYYYRLTADRRFSSSRSFSGLARDVAAAHTTFIREKWSVRASSPVAKRFSIIMSTDECADDVSAADRRDDNARVARVSAPHGR